MLCSNTVNTDKTNGRRNGSGSNEEVQEEGKQGWAQLLVTRTATADVNAVNNYEYRGLARIAAENVRVNQTVTEAGVPLVASAQGGPEPTTELAACKQATRLPDLTTSFSTVSDQQLEPTSRLNI